MIAVRESSFLPTAPNERIAEKNFAPESRSYERRSRILSFDSKPVFSSNFEFFFMFHSPHTQRFSEPETKRFRDGRVLRPRSRRVRRASRGLGEIVSFCARANKHRKPFLHTKPRRYDIIVVHVQRIPTYICIYIYYISCTERALGKGIHGRRREFNYRGVRIWSGA